MSGEEEEVEEKESVKGLISDEASCCQLETGGGPFQGI